jgi:hypothetical protein
MMMLLLQLSANLSLYVKKLNWMEKYYQHIQKQIISLAKFYINNFTIAYIRNLYMWFLIIFSAFLSAVNWHILSYVPVVFL